MGQIRDGEGGEDADLAETTALNQLEHEELSTEQILQEDDHSGRRAEAGALGGRAEEEGSTQIIGINTVDKHNFRWMLNENVGE